MSSMLNALGTSISLSTKLEEITCRGLLRLCIMDSMEQLKIPNDPRQTTAYINRMTYNDWKGIVESQVLSSRLTNSGVSDPARVVTALKQTLMDKQSLLTMAA